jgi:hypothetical protein
MQKLDLVFLRKWNNYYELAVSTIFILLLLLLCLFCFSTLENAATHSFHYHSEQVEHITKADFVEDLR